MKSRITLLIILLTVGPLSHADIAKYSCIPVLNELSAGIQQNAPSDDLNKTIRQLNDCLVGREEMDAYPRVEIIKQNVDGFKIQAEMWTPTCAKLEMSPSLSEPRDQIQILKFHVVREGCLGGEYSVPLRQVFQIQVDTGVKYLRYLDSSQSSYYQFQLVPKN